MQAESINCNGEYQPPTGTADVSSSSKTYQDLTAVRSVSGDSVKYTDKVKKYRDPLPPNVVVTDTLPGHVKVKAGTVSPTPAIITKYL